MMSSSKTQQATITRRSPRSRTLEKAITRRAARKKNVKQQISTPPEPESIFPFFKLPREIRDRIYDLVWSTKTPVLARHDIYSYRVEYAIASGQTLTRQRCPHWLTVNKQLTQEMVEQFQRLAVWTHIEDYWYQVSTKQTWSLVSPWTAHTLRIPCLATHFLYNLSSDGKNAMRRIELLSRWGLWFKKFSASKSVPNFKKIVVSIQLQHYLSDRGADASVTIADLTPLEVLKADSIQCVDITLVLGYGGNSVGGSSPTMDNAQLRMKEEIARVGNVLVGGEAAVEESIERGFNLTTRLVFQRR